MRQQFDSPAGVARTLVVVRERSGQRDRALRKSTRPAPSRSAAGSPVRASLAAELARVGNHELIARLPAVNRPLEREGGLPGERLPRQPEKRRRLDGAVHRDVPERDDAVTDLARIDLRVERPIGDHDFGRHVGRDRRRPAPDLERAFRQHHDRDDLQPRVRVGLEGERAADLDAVDRGIRHHVVGHRVAGANRDLVVRARYLPGGPRLRVRPGAAGCARDRGAARRKAARPAACR